MSSKPAPTYDVDFLRRIEDPTLNDISLARNAQILNDLKTTDSEILTFFKEKVVLITGVTGFVGKVLLEKLLRSCLGIKAVFILVRQKKGLNLNERLDNFFEQSIFDRLKKEQPNFRKKIVAILADFEQMNIGITDEDRERIQESVSVIFHAAATVRFQDPIRQTVRTNVRGTAEILKLALGCQRLESFVHFSTAYSFVSRDDIDEKFYDPPMSPTTLIEYVENTDEKTLEKHTDELLGDFKNPYVFSKAVAENLIKEIGKKLPICIFRPSIIISTYREPVRGWGDNIYGLSGVLMAAGVGLMHAFYCDSSKIADVVPVDMVANASIACAWRTARDGLRTEAPLIYNYVSTCQKPITYGEIKRINHAYGINKPTVHCVWYYSFFMTKCWYFYKLCVLFLHFIPAYFIDGFNKLRGKEARMVTAYQKIDKFADSLRHFTIRDWKFSNNNVQELWEKLNPADKHIFHFNIAELDWERHAETYLLGLRVYFLKDPTSTVPQARIKWNRLKYLHYTVKYTFISLAILLVWYIFTSIFL